MLPSSARYPLDHIITCELLHFALAFSAGLLAFLWTWTICSRVWPGKRTYLSPYAAALFCAALSHWIEDNTLNWF
ncbi:MAG TPA: hypothetical protein VLH13_01075 [Methanomassiliicoccales archaeon]|nr:hypothetical protein [Methanomassiliicoccales archaeon]